MLTALLGLPVLILVWQVRKYLEPFAEMNRS